MGTEIVLSIQGVDLTYSKNHMGIDHGALFQDADLTRIRSEAIDYDYFKANQNEGLAEMEEGFSKRLREVASRVELLGFNLEAIRDEYNACVEECREARIAMEGYGDYEAIPCMEFNEFVEIVSSIKIDDLERAFDSQSFDKDPSIYGAKFVDANRLNNIPFYEAYDIDAYSEQSFLAGLLGFLHPYSALRLLAENPENLEENVVWQFGPLVQAGWEKRSLFKAQARRRESFLIVTEGHTDALILDLAIKTLRPEISDFFCFIDMTDGHPFGGTGPLQKFAKGLAQMDVQNKTLFLFDNDTEGLSAYRATKKLPLPINMRVMMLPERDEFKSFVTLGPSGEEVMDINKKAAAIECYLDLNQPSLPEPLVRWSGFKGDVQQYQGALYKKEAFTKNFLRYSSEELIENSYDLSKLSEVVGAIYQECVKIACDCRGY